MYLEVHILLFSVHDFQFQLMKLTVSTSAGTPSDRTAAVLDEALHDTSSDLSPTLQSNNDEDLENAQQALEVAGDSYRPGVLAEAMRASSSLWRTHTGPNLRSPRGGFDLTEANEEVRQEKEEDVQDQEEDQEEVDDGEDKINDDEDDDYSYWAARRKFIYRMQLDIIK